MLNETSVFDNISELDAPPANLDSTSKVEWYIRKAQSIKIQEREKTQKPKTDPVTGKRYTNIPIAKTLDVDPALVKECKVIL
jgi:hypothetical protein